MYIFDIVFKLRGIIITKILQIENILVFHLLTIIIIRKEKVNEK